jgi:RND family efflux transporter MFP subunit
MSLIPARSHSARPHPRRSSRGRLLGAAILAALLAGGCGQGQQTRAPKKIEVTVTTPITDTVWDYQDFTGRLSAVKSVDIRARVTGYVTEADFKEGEHVEEGQVLFRIDSRSYEADLKLAKANVKLAEAQRQVQEKIARRAERLVGVKGVSQEEYELALASMEKDRASVDAAEANRERAQLYKDWTEVKAPLRGRVSRRLVDPGNLVVADTTILTTLVTEDPLYAYFDVDERTFLNLMGSHATGLSPWVSRLKLPVLMRLANEDDFIQPGMIDFIDNQVIATTGTIRMRGVFQNARGFLKPGLFARIRLPVGTPYKAILIPDEALLSDQGRKYVYVVNSRNEVVYRKVSVGQTVGGLRVIHPPAKGKEGKEGLVLGERVIVTNQQRVRPGLEVRVKVQPPPVRPDSPLGKLLAAHVAREQGGP